MKNMTNEKLIESLEWRYATKKFDPTKKISSSDWEAIEKALILTPSSYGLQPWKFIVVENQDIKNQLTQHSWNQKQVAECSHLVVLTIKNNISEEDVKYFINETAKARGVDASTLEGYQKMIIGDVVKGYRSTIIKEWATRQAYIALGNLMTSAAVLGLDTCPMEGINPEKYDEVLGLKNSEFMTVVACPVGYRASEDKYASIKKVRYAKEKMILTIK